MDIVGYPVASIYLCARAKIKRSERKCLISLSKKAFTVLGCMSASTQFAA